MDTLEVSEIDANALRQNGARTRVFDIVKTWCNLEYTIYYVFAVVQFVNKDPPLDGKSTLGKLSPLSCGGS
jgi:hypothetical protein